MAAFFGTVLISLINNIIQTVAHNQAQSVKEKQDVSFTLKYRSVLQGLILVMMVFLSLEIIYPYLKGDETTRESISDSVYAYLITGLLTGIGIRYVRKRLDEYTASFHLRTERHICLSTVKLSRNIMQGIAIIRIRPSAAPV